MSKCLIVYHSYHHGNTGKIAEEMAQAVNAELCTTDKLEGHNIEDYDIIGFGGGIAYGKHYKELFDAAEKMNLTKKKVFVFSTSGSAGTKQNKALLDVLEGKGAFIAGSFNCRGFDTYGPFKLVGGIAKGHPNAEDFAAARSFIADVVNK